MQPGSSTSDPSLQTSSAATSLYGAEPSSVDDADDAGGAGGEGGLVPVEHQQAPGLSSEKEDSVPSMSLQGLKWGDYIRFKYQVRA